MERAPKSRSTRRDPVHRDKEINDVFDFVYQNAMGIPIQFISAPTLAQMKGNTWGVFGTDLYIKFGNNTGIKLAGAALA